MFALRRAVAYFFVAVLTVQLASAASVCEAAPPIQNKKLLQKVKVSVTESPLKDVMASLTADYGVEISFDPTVDAVDPSLTASPVTLQAEGITLLSAIHLLCGSLPISVVAIPEGQKVRIIAAETDEANLFEAEYRTADLGPLAADPSQLAAAIESVTSGPWKSLDAIGGEFTVLEVRGFKVSQNRKNHAEIEELLSKLAGAVRGRAVTTSTPIDQANERIKKALVRAVAFPEGEMTLADFLQQVFDTAKMPCWIDQLHLGDAGIPLDTKVSSDGKRHPLGEYVASVLAPLKIARVVRDEVVVITSQEYLDEQQEVRVYDVRRLLGPMVDADVIAQRVQSLPDSGPWYDIDGVGGVVVSLGQVLVIRHTPAVHEKITAALTMAR